MLRIFLLTGTAAIAAGFSTAAAAQDAPAPPLSTPDTDTKQPPATEDAAAPTPMPPATTPPATGQEIVVTGFRRNREDILAGTSVVSGVELTRDLRPTIGETLSRQPGVSATSFGPNASRPILRGFQGERIRILTDGIGSLDVSNTSVDHAVAINPLTAERIEVLRGPGALLFGSAAIGGVVNVIDARIPRRVPDEPFHVQGLLTYGSAADERSANGAVDVPIGGHFVVHIDGNYSKTDDLRIGGYVLSPELRREAAASPDPDVQALAHLSGRLPNSDGRTSDIAAGAAWIDGSSNVGFSINHFASFYGIPIRYPLDPALEAEKVHIDLKQTRVDGRAEFGLGGGFIDSVRLRGGYSDYRHSEIDESGAIGTTFFNKGYEGRLEFVQATKGGFGGGFGAQYFHRDLNVVGNEKALPRNTTSQAGIFALESYSTGKLKAELGGRYERQTVHGDADAVVGNPDITRTFDAFSGSLGASYGTSALRFGLNASHTERAPGAEELYINGPHPGTQAFEIGNPNFKKEVSNGIEATLHGSGDGYSFSASAYSLWFSHYIYEQETGVIQDNLPVFQQRQASARYVGFEVEGSLRLATIGSVRLNANALADYVKATVVHVGPAPRIPPLRMLGAIEAQSDLVNARLEVEKVTRQRRLAPLETPTDGYTMVNASISISPLRAHKELSFTLSANNIFDVDARRSASFLKDYAPLAGRDIRLSARFAF
ncbi:MAG: iron complex outerrane recepter protein [Sphingomonadales bacterium]|jgi:iron complex outermembrane receptor protein|nr:iron complex outerrane recepter protein [Sphingomonadales bacterium]